MSEIIPNQEGIVQDYSFLITNNQKKTEHGLYFVINSKKQSANTIIDVYSLYFVDLQLNLHYISSECQFNNNDIKQTLDNIAKSAEYHNKQLTREKGTQV